MSDLHITDPATTTAVRQLAQVMDTSITEAVRTAVTNELNHRGIELPAPPVLDEKLVVRLDKEIRDVTLQYVRLKAAATGKPSGSRVYQMLVRNGPVETLNRLIGEPTEGLHFLNQKDRLDLAAESIALKAEYVSIVNAATRARARENLERIKGVR